MVGSKHPDLNCFMANVSRVQNVIRRKNWLRGKRPVPEFGRFPLNHFFHHWTFPPQSFLSLLDALNPNNSALVILRLETLDRPTWDSDKLVIAILDQVMLYTSISKLAITSLSESRVVGSKISGLRMTRSELPEKN